MQPFKLNVSDLLGKTLDEVKSAVEGAGVPLGEIKFMELVLFDPQGEPQPLHYGVYLFFNEEGQCTYVGQTVKGFVARMGEHFSTHEKSPRNGYLGLTAGDGHSGHYHGTAAGLLKHRLTLVYLEGKDWKGGDFLDRLELTLQAAYCPDVAGDGDHFLIKPKQRASLHSIKAKQEGNATLAELLPLAK